MWGAQAAKNTQDAPPLFSLGIHNKKSGCGTKHGKSKGKKAASSYVPAPANGGEGEDPQTSSTAGMLQLWWLWRCVIWQENCIHCQLVATSSNALQTIFLSACYCDTRAADTSAVHNVDTSKAKGVLLPRCFDCCRHRPFPRWPHQDQGPGSSTSGQSLPADLQAVL
jgi:hypothetical protein